MVGLPLPSLYLKPEHNNTELVTLTNKMCHVNCYQDSCGQTDKAFESSSVGKSRCVYHVKISTMISSSSSSSYEWKELKKEEI